MTFTFRQLAAIIAASFSALIVVGCATAPDQAAEGVSAPGDFAKWPCLSYSLPCAKTPTREAQKKSLAGPLNGDFARGKAIAHERSKGNCLACHVMKDGVQPGTRGPDLSRYGALGKTDAETYSLVHDMRTRSPDTVMPPFGTNEILTDQEIRDVVAYLQTST
jgi:sulfur-oxidizing protein SoxX